MKHLIIIILLFTCAVSNAQVNLVLNANLEQYSHCPDEIDEIKYATNWSQLDTNWSPPDWAHDYSCGFPEYCNVCGAGPGCAVPYNGFYYNYPHSGKGMAQLTMYSNPLFGSDRCSRDYMQGKLLANLIPGQSYCVSFYVAIEQGSTYAVNHIGAYLDDGTIDTTHLYGTPQTQYTPQIYSTSVMYDTVSMDSMRYGFTWWGKWVKIQGSFIANGNEKFITIGNFSDLAHTSAIAIQDTIGEYLLMASLFAYYLVDDISVIRSDARPNAGPNHSIPIGGVDSVIIGDTLDTYLPVYWYVNGVKIDSNKASIKVKPDTTTTYVIGLSLCGGGGEATVYDTVTVYVGSLVTSLSPLVTMKPLIYPNPAANQITIAQALGTILTITDLPGREVLRTNLNSNIEQVDLSALLPGVYMVQVCNPSTGEKVVKRVVKE